MDIKRIRCDAAVGPTWAARFVPLYEVRCIREWAKRKTRGMISPDDMRVSKDVPDHIEDVIGASMYGEMARLKQKYRQDFEKAYPTEEDFADEFNATLDQYKIDVPDEVDPRAQGTVRTWKPIEEIKGIGPSIADAIAVLLGDGELATLAEADPMELIAVDGLSLSGSVQVVADAKALCGVVYGDDETDEDPAE